jgi:hypothetical protein
VRDPQFRRTADPSQARDYSIHRHQCDKELGIQIVWLFVLAIPVASISWTVTHEEVFREAREFLVRKSRSAKG